MKPPAFQFYADDFLAGTFSMSNEERGLYITLLCRQWTQGYVTKEEMARLSTGMAQPLVSHVLAKFRETESGVFQNARMESERDKQAQFRANRSESGKAGADKRWHSHSTAIAQPMANTMAKHSSPSPSPSPSKMLKERNGHPSLDEVKMNAARIGQSDEDAESFWHHFESSGWIDKNGNPVVKWQSKQAGWKNTTQANKFQESQSGGGAAEMILMSNEYKRVCERITKIQTNAAQDAMGAKLYTQSEKAELVKMRARRDELKKKLGITI